MQKQLSRFLVAGIAAVSRALAASPDADCQQESNECVIVGQWNLTVALGAGVRTNPLVDGQALPIVVIPHFSYYGKRFFIDNLDLGFTLAESTTNSLSIVASPGYDRVFFYRSDLQNIFLSGFPGESHVRVPPNTPGAVPFPPRPRRVTYLAGPEWTFKFRGVTGQLDLMHEITDQNRGNEARAALSVPLLQSETGSALALNIGITWKSAAIVNYYYGAPHIYEAGSALDPFLKVSYTRRLAGKWRLNALVEYDKLGKAIADSPIIAKDYVVTAFIGAIYPF
jgi:outer membrane protein